MIGQILRFSLIGVAATLVHLLVGVTLIHAGWSPLIANAAAFGTAFLVSFAGHFGYTFPSRNASAPASLVRFLVVALCGFAANETILAGLLSQHILPPPMTLVVSTGLVALATFILCRRWAFAARERHRTSKPVHDMTLAANDFDLLHKKKQAES